MRVNLCNFLQVLVVLVIGLINAVTLIASLMQWRHVHEARATDCGFTVAGRACDIRAEYLRSLWAFEILI